MTVGAVIARNYAEFLPGWLASVGSLHVTPAEVVLVTDIADVPSWVRVVAPPTREFRWADWHNALFETAATEYVSWVNADDRYRPEALDRVDDWSTDVIGFNARIVGRPGDADPARFLAVPDANAIRRGEATLIPCGSPVRRSAWADVDGFDQRFYPGTDLAFWTVLAATGHTFSAYPHVLHYDYRWHPDTPVDYDHLRPAIREHASTLSREAHRWPGPV